MMQSLKEGTVCENEFRVDYIIFSTTQKPKMKTMTFVGKIWNEVTIGNRKGLYLFCNFQDRKLSIDGEA